MPPIDLILLLTAGSAFYFLGYAVGRKAFDKIKKRDETVFKLRCTLEERIQDGDLKALKAFYTVQRDMFPELAPIVAEAINDMEAERHERRLKVRVAREASGGGDEAREEGPKPVSKQRQGSSRRRN